MSEVEIAARIDRELSECTSLDNAHGITLENISRHRITPELSTFENASPIGQRGAMIDVWIVLDEAPLCVCNRYLIVFNPASGMFGLALAGDSQYAAAFLGDYGSFIEAVNAM